MPETNPSGAGPEAGTEAEGRGPLSGVTVVDLTAALAGPYATLLLAGLGAKVIKVEPPVRGDTARGNAPYVGRDGVSLSRRHDDDLSLAIIDRARNKLSVTLDLKHSEAPAMFADLVRAADVVVENYSRGTADRLGVGFEAARRANRKIVYCSISGFGGSGDPGSGKAMDTIIQAMSGVMFTSGGPEDPPVRVGIPLGDLTAPLYAVVGLLAALLEARATGRGQHVDISMLGVLTSMVACEPFQALQEVGIPTRTGNTVPRLAPFGVFAAKDGYIALCAPTDAFAAGVFRAIGQEQLATEARFATRDRRVANADVLHELVATSVAGRLAEEAAEAFSREGVPAAVVAQPIEAVGRASVRERAETVPLAHPSYGEVDGVLGAGIPIQLSDSHVGLERPAPVLGEHNDAVYGGLLGYSEERIAALRAAAVI